MFYASGKGMGAEPEYFWGLKSRYVYTAAPNAWYECLVSNWMERQLGIRGGEPGFRTFHISQESQKNNNPGSFYEVTEYLKLEFMTSCSNKSLPKDIWENVSVREQRLNGKRALLQHGNNGSRRGRGRK